MATATRFEELDVYQLAVELRRAIVRATSAGEVARDFRFVQQLRDAVRGGPRNIAEGFTREVPTEFARFLEYAKASIDETKAHVQDGYESGYFNDEDFERFLSLIRRTIAGINRLHRYLNSPEAKRAYERIKKKRLTQPRPTREPENQRT
jgi:four helix bundle protein